MKKLVGITTIVILLMVISLFAIWFFGNYTEVDDGTYKIQNNTTYPEAYIIIENGHAQFFNIDLNALYKKNIVERYISYLENYKKQTLSDSDKDKIEKSIDLNAQFCTTKFELDYSEENYNHVDKSNGICNYNFGKITDIDYLSYDYDWKKNSITLTRNDADKIFFTKK